ncbi:MAG: GNAT family N-acetyltransferase [Hyphomicrobiales bacterium]
MSKITRIGGGGASGGGKGPTKPSKPKRKTQRKSGAPEPIPVTVTFLEMFAEPLLRVPVPAQKLALMRAEKPEVHFTRYLYETVGADFVWVDRRRVSDADLAAVVQDEDYETYVLYKEGCPAGYFELDCRNMPDIELAYFGLFPDATGFGLGRYLLAQAIRTAWSHEPQRVHVETCTLDHPAALPLYQKLGFSPYKQVEKEIIPLDEP